MSHSDEHSEDAVACFRKLMMQPAAPAELVAAMEAAVRQRPHKRRGLQADVLARVFKDAAEAATRCGWGGRVVISDGRVLVDQDGALFPVDVSNRYLRTDGLPPGALMLHNLDRLGISPRIIFHVGANIGEIAIYLARRCPKARVFAFEPAPENIAGFQANLALQRPPLANLKLITEAVSDRSGAVRMTVGGGLLNTTLIEERSDRLARTRDLEVIDVPADTLTGFAERLEAPTIDFLKIDVEGGEPRLATSIRALGPRIRAAFVEISSFNTLEAYFDLVDAFASAGLVLAKKNLSKVEKPRQWLEENLPAVGAMNVWFVDPARTIS